MNFVIMKWTFKQLFPTVPPIWTKWKTTSYHALDIQVLSLDNYLNVAGLNYLLGFQNLSLW